MLHELAPKAAVIAVLLNPKLATADSQLKDLQVAARALGLQIQYSSCEPGDGLGREVAGLRNGSQTR